MPAERNTTANHQSSSAIASSCRLEVHIDLRGETLHQLWTFLPSEVQRSCHWSKNLCHDSRATPEIPFLSIASKIGEHLEWWLVGHAQDSCQVSHGGSDRTKLSHSSSKTLLYTIDLLMTLHQVYQVAWRNCCRTHFVNQ